MVFHMKVILEFPLFLTRKLHILYLKSLKHAFDFLNIYDLVTNGSAKLEFATRREKRINKLINLIEEDQEDQEDQELSLIHI